MVEGDALVGEIAAGRGQPAPRPRGSSGDRTSLDTRFSLNMVLPWPNPGTALPALHPPWSRGPSHAIVALVACNLLLSRALNGYTTLEDYYTSVQLEVLIMTFFDKHSLDHADPFYFDEYNMIDHVITTVRRLYGITGAVGLLAGLALLFWPVKTLVVLTVVLGIYL